MRGAGLPASSTWSRSGIGVWVCEPWTIRRRPRSGTPRGHCGHEHGVLGIGDRDHPDPGEGALGLLARDLRVAVLARRWLVLRQEHEVLPDRDVHAARDAAEAREGSLGRAGSEMSTTMKPSSRLGSSYCAQAVATARSPQNEQVPSEPIRFPTRRIPSAWIPGSSVGGAAGESVAASLGEASAAGAAAPASRSVPVVQSPRPQAVLYTATSQPCDLAASRHPFRGMPSGGGGGAARAAPPKTGRVKRPEASGSRSPWPRRGPGGRTRRQRPAPRATAPRGRR